MSDHTPAWQEFNEAQREYYGALEEQHRVQERLLPAGEPRSPHSPVLLPNPITLEMIKQLSEVDRLVHNSRQRYAKAINSIHKGG